MWITLISTLLLAGGCLGGAHKTRPGGTFTVAVIPDTENMLDYKHQKDAGFAIDSAKLFMQQMAYIAENSVNRGEEIVFASSAGADRENKLRFRRTSE